MVKICHQLLDRPDVETAIRVGDGFALLIEFYYAQRNMEQVHAVHFSASLRLFEWCVERG